MSKKLTVKVPTPKKTPAAFTGETRPPRETRYARPIVTSIQFEREDLAMMRACVRWLSDQKGGKGTPLGAFIIEAVRHHPSFKLWERERGEMFRRYVEPFEG
jgi:hypothetical protein